MNKLLLSSVLGLLLLTGCNDKEAQEEQKIVAEKPKVVEQEPVQDELMQKVKDSSKAITEKVTEASKQIGEIVSKTSKEIGVEASKVVDDVASKSDEISEVVTKEVESSKDKIEATINNIMSSSKDTDNQGRKLYMKCAGCHGQNAQLVPTIGRAKIIRGWEKARIINALKGYREGKYGGPMKGIMRGQVAALSDKEIEILADYISKL